MQKLRKNSDFILALGLIGVFVPLIVYILRHQFTIYAQIIFLIGFICLGLFAGLEWPRLLNTLRGRQVRYGGNALLMSLLFIGIIVIVAFMSERYFKRIDLTANKSFSISQQTTKVLDNLDRSVKVWAFYGQYGDRTGTEALLKSYQQSAAGKISYEFIDPDARPTLARQYGIAEGESDILILEAGDRKQKLTGATESDITSGLLNVTRDQKKVVYLLTGHGEYSPDDPNQSGILLVKQAMEGDNYTVKNLNLLTGAAVTTTTGITLSGSLTNTGNLQFGKIPADAAVLIIDAPQSPIPVAEQKVIFDWLDRGGKLFVMLDALDGPSGLEDLLLANWGLGVRNDLVIDQASAALGDAATLVISRADFSPITQNMRTQAVLPGARSIATPAAAPDGTTITTLAKSSEQSWGETNLAGLNTGVRYDSGADAPGPLTVAVTAERNGSGSGKARLVVYGNARFATDRWQQTGSNLEFFLNAVNWLSEDEQLISIRTRPMTDRSLFIPPASAKLIAFGSALGLPLLALLAGAIVWWRRR